jgi:leucyl-tRNA synthetase
VLHATLKKVTEDIEKMSFNTSVSQFMIAVNELGALKCHKRDVLEPLTIALGTLRAAHRRRIVGEAGTYHQHHHRAMAPVGRPIPGGGQLQLPDQLQRQNTSATGIPHRPGCKSVEAAVLANPEVQQRLEGKAPKKVIVVPKRIVNIVV